jgi:hypothetical protein
LRAHPPTYLESHGHTTAAPNRAAHIPSVQDSFWAAFSPSVGSAYSAASTQSDVPAQFESRGSAIRATLRTSIHEANRRTLAFAVGKTYQNACKPALRAAESHPVRSAIREPIICADGAALQASQCCAFWAPHYGAFCAANSCAQHATDKPTFTGAIDLTEQSSVSCTIVAALSATIHAAHGCPFCYSVASAVSAAVFGTIPGADWCAVKVSV